MVHKITPQQQALITQYTAELEGELTRCWHKTCLEYGLDLQEDYENLPYALFACGFLDGVHLAQKKLISLLDLKIDELGT